MFCFFSFSFSQQKQLADGVLALVGDRVILNSSVMEESFFLAQQKGISPQENPFQFRALFNKVLKEKIHKNLVLVASEKDTTINITHENIKKNLNDRIDYFVLQLGSVENLEKEMGMSVEEIKSRYHDEIKEELFVGAYQQKLFGGVGISRQEVSSFYSENKDSLPKTPSRSSFSLIQKKVGVSKKSEGLLLKNLSALRDSLVSGLLVFEDVAIKRSQDPSVALNKGKMTTSRGDLVASYEKAAYSLGVGEISAPVLTDFGYHLIKLLGVVGEKITTQHILFLTNPKRADFEVVEKELLGVLASCENDPGLFDSLAVSLKLKEGGASGVYDEVNISSFPLSFVDVFLKTPDFSFSTVFSDSSFCFVFYRYGHKKEELTSLENNWVLVERMALEKKRQEKFELWVEEQYLKTYVKINPIY